MLAAAAAVSPPPRLASLPSSSLIISVNSLLHPGNLPTEYVHHELRPVGISLAIPVQKGSLSFRKAYGECIVLTMDTANGK